MPCPYLKKRRHFWSRDICLEQGGGTPLARDAGQNLCLTDGFHQCSYYLKSDAAKEWAERQKKKKEFHDRRHPT